jgi:hypothetical protein
VHVSCLSCARGVLAYPENGWFLKVFDPLPLPNPSAMLI